MHRFERPQAIPEDTATGIGSSADGDGSAYPPPPRPPVGLGTGLDGLLSPARPEHATPYTAPAAGQETMSPAPPAGCELLEELGRGGMGVVYKARQVDLNRLVAIKMIRAGGMASGQERLRFRTEAQAIARLQHPNIIQVYDVGDAAGHAYLILEFAEGGTLARRLADGPLPPHDAASLTYTLAQAVHYAHLCGIIHRDLKPSNILLAKGSGGRGQGRECRDFSPLASDSSPLAPGPSPLIPKITDFGLAKLLGDESTQTQTGAILGTPNYMAPEQAYGRHQDVSPATDVYALGAMLYEMLTGRPPFCGATPLETLDQVRTSDPVPPRQLQRGIPRDLETICLKCLHKDARRRYPSGEALAEDVRRFLDGAPIRARPVGIWERGVKWVRRRPVAAALSGCALVAAAALLTVGLAYHFELQSALAATTHQRDEAENYYGKMLEAVDSLLTEVGDKDLADIPEMEEARARLYEKALHFHEGLLQDDGDPDPTSRLQQARLLYRIAWLDQWGAKNEHAETYALRSLDLCKQLVEEAPENAVFRRELARVYGVLGQMYDTLDRKAEAESARRQAKMMWESLPLDQPADRADLAGICTVLGLRCTDDRPGEAGKLFGRAIALLQEGPSPKGASSVMTQVYLGEGLLHQKHGRPAEAATAYRKGLATGQAALRDARWVGFNHYNIAQIQHNLGALRVEKEPKEAEDLYRQALELCQQLTRRHPRLPLYAKELASNHDSLAFLYLRTGNAAKAESHLRDALAVHLSGAGRPFLTPLMLAHDLNALGLCCAQGQRFAEAEIELRKAIPTLEPLAGKSSPDRPASLTLAKTMFLLGLVRQQRADASEALKCYERAIGLLEKMQKTGPLDPPDIAILRAAQEGRAGLAVPSSGQVKK